MYFMDLIHYLVAVSTKSILEKKIIALILVKSLDVLTIS
jgi:hypothetical protein